jgi:hypothetical protein
MYRAVHTQWDGRDRSDGSEGPGACSTRHFLSLDGAAHHTRTAQHDMTPQHDTAPLMRRTRFPGATVCQRPRLVRGLTMLSSLFEERAGALRRVV